MIYKHKLIPKLPRSKRLRGAVSTSGTFGRVTTNVTTVSGGGGGPTHDHTNLAQLERIASIDDDGYLYVKHLEEDEMATDKVKAGYADTLSPDSEVWHSFLSKVADDVAHGLITFEQGIRIGQYLQGATGAAIDSAGNAELESLRIRSALNVEELIINRIQALEGDQILTESETIEEIRGDGNIYQLKFREKWEGYVSGLRQDDIIKGTINTLANGGTYATSWMRLTSDPDGLWVEAELYADSDTPAGHNYPPCELMKVARWGNESDETRQDCLYLSSTEGRIVRLSHVNAPKISLANYGSIVGKLPAGFMTDRGLPIIEGQDYAYLRGLIVQDIIRTDYAGNVIPSRGQQYNLLDGTNQGANGWLVDGKDSAYDIAAANVGGTNGVRISRASLPVSLPSWEWVKFPFDAAKLERGKRYTVSFDAECSETGIATLGVRTTNNVVNVTDIADVELGPTRTHYAITLTAQMDGQTNDGHPNDPFGIVLVFNHPVRGNWLWLRVANLKLEEGEEATAWSPSAADLRGPNGATMRGPQTWQALPDGYVFQPGGEHQFLDVVVFGDNYYICKAAHAKSAATTPGTQGGDVVWQLSDKVDMVATKILLAGYAKVSNLGVEHVETTGDGGAKIEVDGGEIRAYGLTGALNIRFGIDEAGYAVLQYYDNDGQLLYDLGPNGIRNTESRGASWSEVYLKDVSFAAMPSPTTTQIAATSVTIGSTKRTFYRYSAPITVGLVGDDNGTLFRSASTSDTKVSGWFAPTDANGNPRIASFRPQAAELGEATADETYLPLYYYDNGKITRTIKARYT